MYGRLKMIVRFPVHGMSAPLDNWSLTWRVMTSFARFFMTLPVNNLHKFNEHRQVDELVRLRQCGWRPDHEPSTWQVLFNSVEMSKFWGSEQWYVTVSPAEYAVFVGLTKPFDSCEGVPHLSSKIFNVTSLSI